ncbi:MAG: CAP domain-containing protein [Actinobacteria bacterium]|nr:CAP domain-containing protein [Actinomycetota bacterium]
MRRGFALVLAAAALGSSLAVGTGEAAVSRQVESLVQARLAGVVKASAKPARNTAPHGSRAKSAMAVLEETVVDRMNQVRRPHGLRALRLSRPLGVAADFHSRDMGRRGYFEHDSIVGTPFWRRIERFYPSRGFRSWTVGENLLWGTDTYSAAFAVREWMNSPPHRENLLSREWREVGIGAIHLSNAPGTFRGNSVTILTADFGARR